MAKPIIGIPAERRLVGDSYRHTVNQGEVAAIIKAGGIPVLIPTRELALASNYSRLIDGLLLPGGPDVAPRFFGEEPLPEMAEADDRLDATEIELIKLAVAAGKPMLGICRGAQVVNIALGGDIYQDIAKQIDHQTYQHHQKAPYNQGSHYVDIAEGSMLQTIFQGQQHVLVNSYHHQAVRKLAPQLKLTAKAGDGVAEAVESKDSRLILAVQWHPELMYKEQVDEFAIFENFIERVKEA
ncbi:glutamine amidotransferase [Secundilactobacillus pentosiphilus]|uniref:Glutamine amidotransferase n=1 Tax=Secundilactobacillus pentosiphilus TaxID=1714682 RepID=A0A1Z5IY34_9LACO|nr:gamma-glutamyl-gamma-aminobutyrate hydrolase family protein [Secundilactobacillus pentosiphilus]GAX06579.1 glutamine amidotransferase [Secundilactobacillus pentosiphilus]